MRTELNGLKRRFRYRGFPRSRPMRIGHISARHHHDRWKHGPNDIVHRSSLNARGTASRWVHHFLGQRSAPGSPPFGLHSPAESGGIGGPTIIDAVILQPLSHPSILIGLGLRRAELLLLTDESIQLVRRDAEDGLELADEVKRRDLHLAGELNDGTRGLTRFPQEVARQAEASEHVLSEQHPCYSGVRRVHPD